MEKNTTKEEKIAAIIDWFKDHEEEFNAAIEELDVYNGCLDEDRYNDMDMLDEIFSGTEPTEILFRAFYGYDEDTYTTGAFGEKLHGPFNPNCDYFRLDAYDNLVSANYKDYSKYLNPDTVEDMSENRNYIDTINNNPELSELFDALEECDE